jgi:hypothetical protein
MSTTTLDVKYSGRTSMFPYKMFPTFIIIIFGNLYFLNIIKTLKYFYYVTRFTRYIR